MYSKQRSSKWIFQVEQTEVKTNWKTETKTWHTNKNTQNPQEPNREKSISNRVYIESENKFTHKHARTKIRKGRTNGNLNWNEYSVCVLKGIICKYRHQQ